LNYNCNSISQIGTVLYGRLHFTFTTPAAVVDFPIRLTVTDTVAFTMWDTISTSCLALSVGSNGNMGQNATDSVNMDYYRKGDCDTGRNGRGDEAIYLYDGSPVVIRHAGVNNERVSWSIYSDGFVSENGLKPMTGPGYAPHGSFSTASYDGFFSGTFVTIDSLVKLEKTWWRRSILTAAISLSSGCRSSRPP